MNANSRLFPLLSAAGLCALLAACASTSDSQPNPKAGTGHPLVEGEKRWPIHEPRPGEPSGIWFPAKGAAQGTVVCLHGIQAHGGWFAPLAAPLTAAGWNVVAPDRRGSGVNTATPFQKGHAASDEELLQDLSEQIAAAQKLAPGKPVILLGTSWGSNLAGAYCVGDLRPQPAALVQLVPATKTRYGFFAELNTLLARQLPFGDMHYLPGAIQPKSGRLQAPPKTGEPPSDSPAAKSDPIWKWIATDRESKVLITKPSRSTILAGRALTKTWTKAEPGTLPRMLVIVATRDQIMNNAAAIAAAKNATAPKKAAVAPIEAGHGAQLSHPREVARALLDWVKTWQR